MASCRKLVVRFTIELTELTMEKSLREKVEEIIGHAVFGAISGREAHPPRAANIEREVDALLSLITQDRKNHEQALNAIEQKKKDHTCEFDCVGCLANGFNACRMVMLEASLAASKRH